MDSALHKTVYHLTGQTGLQAVPVGVVESMVKEYPYFTPAQLIYTAKLQSEESPLFTSQFQKVGLYFNNHKWLQYQLNGLSAFHFFDEKPTAEATEAQLLVAELPEEETSIEQSTNKQPLLSSSIVIPTIEDVKTMMELNQTEEENGITKIDDKQKSAAEMVDTEEIPTLSRQLEEESVNHVDNKDEEPSHSILAKIKADFEEKPVDANEKFSFETEQLYTIDYFASQGIVFDIHSQPEDNLTRKMLKFTDWLKRMKSLKEAAMHIAEDEAADLDAAIRGIAHASNQSKEIVTETMAQVFEKQGKTDKAIQLYIKLSFLNPNKNAYFATKIQELKGLKN